MCNTPASMSHSTQEVMVKKKQQKTKVFLVKMFAWINEKNPVAVE